jgi:hypothetical protein
VAVDFIPKGDKFVGTHYGTETTSLASLLIDFDFGHDSTAFDLIFPKYIIKLANKVKGVTHGGMVGGWWLEARGYGWIESPWEYAFCR